MEKQPISTEELAKIIADNSLYIQTNGHEGVGANLEGAYLEGANLRGVNLRGAKGFKPFICVGPIGSRQAYTTIFLTEDRIQCGCFEGTLDTLHAKVLRTHGDHPTYLAEYLGLIAYAKTLRDAQPHRPTEEAKPPAPFQEGDRVRLSTEARERYPWFKGEQGNVMSCAGGWTSIKFDDSYMSFPNEYLERIDA